MARQAASRHRRRDILRYLNGSIILRRRTGMILRARGVKRLRRIGVNRTRRRDHRRQSSSRRHGRSRGQYRRRVRKYTFASSFPLKRLVFVRGQAYDYFYYRSSLPLLSLWAGFFALANSFNISLLIMRRRLATDQRIIISDRARNTNRKTAGMVITKGLTCIVRLDPLNHSILALFKTPQGLLRNHLVDKEVTRDQARNNFRLNAMNALRHATNPPLRRLVNLLISTIDRHLI